MGNDSDPQGKFRRNPINVTKNSKRRFNLSTINNKFKRLKKLNRSVILAGSLVGILLIVGGISFAASKNNNGKIAETDNAEKVVEDSTTPKIKGIITHKEGNLEFKTEGGDWQIAHIDTEIEESMTVKTTGAASRGSIKFENGNIVRIDANSEIHIDVLNNERVVINQISGYSYNRVNPTDGYDYVVVSDDAQYEAQGTAFRVAASGDEQAIEVFHSTVLETKSNKLAKQGEKLIVLNKAKPDLNKTITKLDVELLKNDQFIEWNIARDKEIPEYKDKLGFLTDITPPTLTIKSHTDGTTVLLEPEATEGTIQFIGNTEKSATVTVQSKSQPNSTPLPVVPGENGDFTTSVLQAPLGNSTFTFIAKDRSGNNTELTIRINFQKKSAPVNNTAIILSGSLSADKKKINLSWELAGGMETPDGVKVVYDITMQPLFGAASAIYADKGTSASIQVSELTKNTKYYFRACKYNKVGSETCSDYSNEVSVTTPE